eukprot:1238750-Amphidinium_carterae.1
MLQPRVREPGGVKWGSCACLRLAPGGECCRHTRSEGYRCLYQQNVLSILRWYDTSKHVWWHGLDCFHVALALLLLDDAAFWKSKLCCCGT